MYTLGERIQGSGTPVILRRKSVVANTVIEDEITEVGPVLKINAVHLRLIAELVKRIPVRGPEIRAEREVFEGRELEAQFGPVVTVPLEIQVDLVVVLPLAQVVVVQVVDSQVISQI